MEDIVVFSRNSHMPSTTSVARNLQLPFHRLNYENQHFKNRNKEYFFDS